MQSKQVISFLMNRISRNIAFWLVFAFFHFYPRNNFGSFLVILCFVSIVYGIPIYINNLVLIPRYLLKRRYFLYFFLLGILLAGATTETFFMNKLAGRFLPPSWNLNPLDSMALPGHILQIVLLFALLAFGKFLSDAIQNERDKEIFQKQQLETELEGLKSQVNPHFLFNALNTIYGMARRTDKATAEAVLQLSEILRHSLYGTSEPKISIAKEIDLLEQYIGFAKLRIFDKERVKLEVNAASGEQKIVPMILLPFVENVFKHGLASDPEVFYASIELSLQGNELVFVCENNNEPAAKDNKEGIGLKNVKRRLHLCYPEKHELQIEKDRGKFSVRLKIMLS
jgi:two-component system LytT family sensor kinase